MPRNKSIAAVMVAIAAMSSLAIQGGPGWAAETTPRLGWSSPGPYSRPRVRGKSRQKKGVI